MAYMSVLAVVPATCSVIFFISSSESQDGWWREGMFFAFFAGLPLIFLVMGVLARSINRERR